MANVPGFGFGLLPALDTRAEPKLVNLADQTGPLAPARVRGVSLVQGDAVS